MTCRAWPFWAITLITVPSDLAEQAKNLQLREDSSLGSSMAMNRTGQVNLLRRRHRCSARAPARLHRALSGYHPQARYNRLHTRARVCCMSARRSVVNLKTEHGIGKFESIAVYVADRVLQSVALLR